MTGASVLVVEDDEGLRRAYRLILESRELAVRDAATLEEAVEAIRTSDHDAVVVDLGLPDATEADAARAIRREAPNAALVVLTGRDDERIREECREAGVTAFRVKPLVGSELADLLEDLVSRSGSR